MKSTAAYEIQTAGFGADPKPAVTPTDEPPARGRSPVLIYTANLTMAVFDVQPGLKAVEAAARELGGFLARQTNTAITVRVPAARFHEALGRLEKLGDVTSPGHPGRGRHPGVPGPGAADQERPGGARAAGAAAEPGEQGRGLHRHRDASWSG